MPPYHISSVSRALYRVFIAPNLTPTSLNPLRAQLRCVPKSHNLPCAQLRFKSFKRAQNQHNLRNHFTLDEAIKSSYINYIDLQGRHLESRSLVQVIRSFDRAKNHLVQVSPGESDPDPDDPSTLPTCKIQPKLDLRMQVAAKMDKQKKHDKQKGQKEGKQVELNWAIDQNDLRHRLGKMRGWLEQGRKVEVVLGPKKRGRAATEEECRGVLKRIREAVAEVGAMEGKEEGGLGNRMVLNFEGVEKKEKPEEKE